MTKSTLTPFLDEIRNRIRLSDLIGRSTKIFRKGRAVKALCPFHNEKTPSFSIDDDRGLYHCFGCQKSGDHFKFVQEMQNLSFMESIQLLADELGLKLPEKESLQAAPNNDALLSIQEEACKWFQEQLQRNTGENARTYLLNRQLSEDSINVFRLGYAPAQGLIAHLKSKGFSLEEAIAAGLALKADDGHSYDRFRNRLIFPITNPKNQVIAFGGRILDKGEPKYLNSSENAVFQKRYVLYGLCQARKHLRTKAIVVEGYMDVIRLHQEGLPYAVAPLGTALGVEHLQQLWRSTPCPIIAFDGDNAGEKAAIATIDKILPFLKPNQSLKFLFLPKGEDPDSYVKKMGKAAFDKLCEKLHPTYALMWQEAIKNFSIERLTPEEFLQIKTLLKNSLNRIENPELRQAYMRQFDQLLYGLQQQKPRPMRQNPIPLPQQNSVTLEKILLVTLVNHPYLWEEVGELLMGINFKDPEIEIQRINIVEHFSVIAPLEDIDTQKISPSLKNIGDDGFYSRVPFAKIGYDREMAKNGWMEAHKKLHNRQFLKNDQQQSAEQLKNDFNLSNWNRLKAMKKSLV